MIIRNLKDAEEQIVHGGTCSVKMLLDSEFESPTAFLNETYVEVGKEVEPHTHLGEEEIYYILEGGGVMKIDGEEKRVGSGDTILTKKGSTHSLKNCGTQRLRMVVFAVRS